MPTIQIADKPTLDNIKSSIDNSSYGLQAIKNAIGGSKGFETIQVAQGVLNQSASTTDADFNTLVQIDFNEPVKIIGIYLYVTSSYVSNAQDTYITGQLKISVDDTYLFNNNYSFHSLRNNGIPQSDRVVGYIDNSYLFREGQYSYKYFFGLEGTYINRTSNYVDVNLNNHPIAGNLSDSYASKAKIEIKRNGFNESLVTGFRSKGYIVYQA